MRSLLVRKKSLPRLSYKLERLKAAEQTVRAIRAGEVDAVVVSGPGGHQVLTLRGGEAAYRALVEAMSEGAASLSAKGVVLYCNRAFASLVRKRRSAIIGRPFRSLLPPEQRKRFAAFLTLARIATARGEFAVCADRRSRIQVHLSLARLADFAGKALGLVVTDLTEQKRQEAEEARKAEDGKNQMMRSMLLARKDERRRIERDLHNEAGQLLTALKAKLYSLEAADTLDSARAQARELQKIAGDTMGELRRVVRDLHSPLVEEMGLTVALARHIEEWSGTHGLPVTFEERGLEGVQLAPETQTGIYRIVQEALTNIAKHADARAVTVRFVMARPGLRLYVGDDGRGFDVAKALADGKHLGLRAMKEQAAILGGSLEVLLDKAKGSTIFAQFPVSARAANSRRASGSALAQAAGAARYSSSHAI